MSITRLWAANQEGARLVLRSIAAGGGPFHVCSKCGRAGAERLNSPHPDPHRRGDCDGAQQQLQLLYDFLTDLALMPIEIPDDWPIEFTTEL
mgnify:CR=1 FL=1